MRPKALTAKMSGCGHAVKNVGWQCAGAKIMKYSLGDPGPGEGPRDQEKEPRKKVRPI